MCLLKLEGTTAVMDCANCPYEQFEGKCITSHLRQLSALSDSNIERLRYEEETIITFEEQKTKILTTYVAIVRQIEAAAADPTTYGLKEDDYYTQRKKLMQNIINELTENPITAIRTIEDYSEPAPTRSTFLEGYRRFQEWLQAIKETISKTDFYKLVSEQKDPRIVFATLAGLRRAEYIPGFLFALPEDAIPLEDPAARYTLEYGIQVQIYELKKSEAHLYTQSNPTLDALTQTEKQLISELITKERTVQHRADAEYELLYQTKMREFYQYILDQASLKNINITTEKALAMAREAANWSVGLGSPIENLALDRAKITDIYIDAENAPIYIEHADFGICHTPWRYSRPMLEQTVSNIVLSAGGTRHFDTKNPILDTMVKRLNMRCHVQGPPATFGEIQLALRLTKDTPFTYAQYVANMSFSPFFTGYDDLLVSLGCSEAVLGLKGVGKTAFTSAKIAAIGTSRRILPIQDIEEIPAKAYRKRGFHIGSMKVQSSDAEYQSDTELSLVALANASLRMGDACIIINELRSRLAIQGIINILNTQPGVFVLYNMHAQSIKDVMDRFELVFGIPSASMFATDRYSFLKKQKFGRKSRIYRVLGRAIETDQQEKQFVDVFKFKPGANIASSTIECIFLRNPEASAWRIDVPIYTLEKNLDINFIPPALQRKCEDTGVSPEQYFLQAFFKGKIYYTIQKVASEMGLPALTELDFVIKCNSEANKLLKQSEREHGEVEYRELEKLWQARFAQLVEEFTGRRPPPPPEKETVEPSQEKKTKVEVEEKKEENEEIIPPSKLDLRIPPPPLDIPEI